MKLLSVIFLIPAIISIVISVLAFLGQIPDKGRNTGIVFAIASGIFGICEFICIMNSPKALFLLIAGILLINLLFTVAQNEKENDNNE